MAKDYLYECTQRYVNPFLLAVRLEVLSLLTLKISFRCQIDYENRESSTVVLCLRVVKFWETESTKQTMVKLNLQQKFAHLSIIGDIKAPLTPALENIQNLTPLVIHIHRMIRNIIIGFCIKYRAIRGKNANQNLRRAYHRLYPRIET